MTLNGQLYIASTPYQQRSDAEFIAGDGPALRDLRDVRAGRGRGDGGDRGDRLRGGFVGRLDDLRGAPTGGEERGDEERARSDEEA
jgi:hypothetical protein